MTKRLDVCVVEIRGLNQCGDIELDLSRDEDNLIRDVLVNLSPAARVIAIFKQSKEQTGQQLKAIDKKPELVIMESGVFCWNQRLMQFDLVESQENEHFESFKFSKNNFFLPIKSFYY